ncbi:MAG: MFS transporter [Planctomycetota bacterium]|nr:MFS transporter [Planctomycetota bacterium]
MLARILKPIPGALPGARASVALLLAINLLNYVDRYVLAAVEPLIRAEFFPPGSPGSENAQAKMGLLATAFLVTYMIAAPLFGWLADRWSRWLIIGCGVLLWSVASGGSGIAHVFWFMLLMRVCVGIGEAAYGPAAPTLIADLYPLERRGQVLAWFYVAIPVGSALGYVLGGVMSKAFTWHWAFLVTLPPGVLLGVLCFLRRDPPRGGAERVAPTKKGATWADYRSLLGTRSYVLNVAAMTAFTFAIGGISFWAPSYFYDQRGFFLDEGPGGLTKVSTIFGGITVVSGLAATLFGGWLADRLRTHVRGSYFVVSGVGMLIAVPFFLGTLYLPKWPAFACMAAAIFFLFVSTGPTNTALANVSRPGVRATAFALCIFVIHALGDAISPPLIGLVSDLTKSAEHPKGNMTLAFLSLTGFILVAGVLWLVGARRLDEDTRRAAE